MRESTAPLPRPPVLTSETYRYMENNIGISFPVPNKDLRRVHVGEWAPGTDTDTTTRQPGWRATRTQHRSPEIFKPRDLRILKVIAATTRTGKPGDVEKLQPDNMANGRFTSFNGTFLLDAGEAGSMTKRTVRDMLGRKADMPKRRLQSIERPWGLPSRLECYGHSNPRADSSLQVLKSRADEREIPYGSDVTEAALRQAHDVWQKRYSTLLPLFKLQNDIFFQEPRSIALHRGEIIYRVPDPPPGQILIRDYEGIEYAVVKDHLEGAEQQICWGFIQQSTIFANGKLLVGVRQGQNDRELEMPVPTPKKKVKRRSEADGNDENNVVEKSPSKKRQRRQKGAAPTRRSRRGRGLDP